HRLDDAVQWLRRLGVTYLRTGLSWADRLRPQALAWFDRQMQALAEFEVTLTFCFTPESRGVMPHYTSPPQCIEEFADFCVEMVRRYAPGTAMPRQLQHVWDGTPLAGQRVLVRCYHGLGDTIQFIRYAPLIKEIAREVMVWAQPVLLPLLRTVRGIDRLLPLHDGAPNVEYDVDVE